MSLKGLNRNQFESALMKILRYRLKDAGRFQVWCVYVYLFIEPEDDAADLDLAFARVSKVFGLAAVSRCAVCDKDFDAICAAAESYLGQALRQVKTFKVEARRADKSFPMTSPQLMRELGAFLLSRHPYLRVDVHQPDFKVIVEVRDRGAYVHGPKTPRRRGPASGHQRPGSEYAVGRHRQPGGGLPDGQAGPGAGSHPLRFPALHLRAGPAAR